MRFVEGSASTELYAKLGPIFRSPSGFVAVGSSHPVVSGLEPTRLSFRLLTRVLQFHLVDL